MLQWQWLTLCGISLPGVHELQADCGHVHGDLLTPDLCNTGEKEAHVSTGKQPPSTLAPPLTSCVIWSSALVPGTSQLWCNDKINIFQGLSKEPDTQ